MNEFDEQVSENLARPFAVAGRRCYLVGYMDGTFPDMGHHMAGEMGGLWLPPLKLADGFWFGLADNRLPTKNHSLFWMDGANCQSFTMKPGQARREFTLTIAEAKITACQEIFVPVNEPGLFVTVTLTNNSENDLDLILAWLVRFDLQGSWWSNWPDRPDEARFDPEASAIFANDTLHPEWWAGMVGERSPGAFSYGANLWASHQTSSLQGNQVERIEMLRNPAELQGQGISGRLDYTLKLGAGQTSVFHFALAGGLDGLSATRPKLTDFLARRELLWAEKQGEMQNLIAHSASIKSPNPALDRAFDQSNLCLDLLTLDIPGLGRGIIAGLQEFAWFFGCDTYYSASGLLIAGQPQTALDSLRLLAGLAQKQGGRIPHEITQSGDIFNPGNTVETGEFVTAVERVFRWTGDRAFLEEVYEVCRTGIFDYMLGECDPTGTLLPDGPGLLELRTADQGKKLDVACSLFQGLQSLAYLAQVMGDTSTFERSLHLVGEVHDRINRYFWSEERQEYAWRIEPDLTLHPEEPAHSYVALEMGLLGEKETGRIARLFARVEGPEHTGPRGLIHPGTVDFVMPIQNAIIALAEFRYGRPDKGLWYLERMAELGGHYMPWAIPEFVGKEACFLQAWSSAAYNWLIVQGLFRLQPDPLTEVVLVQPQLPDDWTFFEAKNLTIWQGVYDLRLQRIASGLEFSYTTRTVSPVQLRFEVTTNPSLPVTFV